jgi:signal peptidase I
MEPTFESREYLIVDELSYYFREPARGEVIVFRYPRDPSKHFIKRVIGLPGETVVVRGEKTYIKEGETLQPLEEAYAAGNFWGNLEVTLGSDEYFVMGDNRAVSLDSRSWGPLPAKLITGRALLRLFPFQQIEFLPG